MNIITATFIGKRIQESGSDSVIDYPVYQFSEIVDKNGNRYKNKWIKETQLLIKSNLLTRKKYTIKLSNSFSDEHINLPYPIEIFDGKNTFIKKGGSIRKKDINGIETNLSPRIF